MKSIAVVLGICLAILGTPAIAECMPKTMTVVHAEGYYPYHWQEGGVVKGIQIDLINEIVGRLAGIPVTNEVFPWSRCQLQVASGEKDAFLTYPSEERREYTEVVSIPFFVSEYVIFTSNNNPFIEELKGVKTLQGFGDKDYIKIVHMRGSGWHKTKLKHVKQTYPVNTAEQMLRMLSMGRVDVVLGQREFFYPHVKKSGIKSDFVEIPNVMDSIQFNLCISKKSPFVSRIPELNKLLEELSASGELEVIRQKIFNKYSDLDR